jgi:hypothetical protein
MARWLSWPPRRRRLLTTALGSLLAVVGIFAVIAGGFWEGSAEETCETHQIACGVFTDSLVAVVAVAIAYGWIIGWVRFRVRREYLHWARHDPASLFEDAPDVDPKDLERDERELGRSSHSYGHGRSIAQIGGRTIRAGRVASYNARTTGSG